MSIYRWETHNGLISLMVGDNLPDPFAHIDARNAPPYVLVPARGEPTEFATCDAAKFALVISLNN